MSGRNGDRLTITDEHLALMRRMYVTTYGIEYGAIAVDGKRPYGNGDVPDDIYEILGWEMPSDEDYGRRHVPYDDQRARSIHDQMEHVVQIALRHPGEDIRVEWVNDWFTWKRSA